MTMTRILLCTILLTAACQVSAATLYRWIEADGSITFSPEPPAAGIAYDTVETGVGNSAAALPATQNAAQSAANPALEPVQRPLQQQPAIQLQPQQGLAYAPSATESVQNSITKATPSTTPTTLAQGQKPNASQSGVVGSSQKHAQCQDLKKRVVSLERRLRSKLSPGEVDNTVVAIVRYQDSFDQFCL